MGFLKSKNLIPKDFRSKFRQLDPERLNDLADQDCVVSYLLGSYGGEPEDSDVEKETDIGE